MDIVERLRAREHCDTWNGEFVSKEAADEIERLREALQMWVKFWENDQSIDVTNDQWLAEEAMEATRQILRDDNV
jgi:hypothetical protein